MGGKRKTRKKPPPKRARIIALDKQFTCLFCSQEETCEVKMDKARKVASISCRICKESFQTKIHELSEPVDVYCDWVDACEEANIVN